MIYALYRRSHGGNLGNCPRPVLLHDTWLWCKASVTVQCRPRSFVTVGNVSAAPSGVRRCCPKRSEINDWDTAFGAREPSQCVLRAFLRGKLSSNMYHFILCARLPHTDRSRARDI